MSSHFSEANARGASAPSDSLRDPLSDASDASDLGADPYPSPALSAYSYTSNSSADFSDFDSELNSLSLDSINEPSRSQLSRLPSDTTNAHNTPSQAYRDQWRRVRAEGSDSQLSGAATPTAASSAAFHLLNGGSRVEHSFSQRSLSPKESQQAMNVDDEDATADRVEDQVELEGEGEGFDLQDEDEEDMHAEGLPAARGWRLDARKADTPEFLETTLKLLSAELKLQGWSAETADPAILPLKAENLKLKRISGAFTNAVFFASYKMDQAPADAQLPPTVLLRVYGPACEALLSRRAELLILHTLSSLYEIGPHILGTFANGRVEEFYDCEPIQKEGMRDLGDREARMVSGGSLVVKGKEGRAHWVARRMNELHAVPLEVMRTVLEQGDLKEPSQKGFGRGIENHIMASSHRPRRRHKHKPSQASTPSGPAAEHLYGLESRTMMRASPAPMGPGEQSEAISIPADIDLHGYYSHRNSSVASLDSLATSYNSQSSMSSDVMSLHGFASPQTGPVSGTASQSSASYFPPVSKTPASPFGLGARANSQSSGPSRGPYPGVWRRMKRWSLEGAKIVQLVEEFAKTETGVRAIAAAFAGHGSIQEEIDQAASGRGGLSTEAIGATPGNLRNTIRCIRAVDLASLYKDLDQFKRFVRKWERREGASKRVFAHNDAQYGNLLEIKHFPGGPEKKAQTPAAQEVDLPAVPAGMPRKGTRRNSLDWSSPALPPARSSSKTRSKKSPPPHHKLVVIDFEYACPNPRGYDIANHFQEWRTDYHHPTMSWSLKHHGAYPDEHERRKWLRAYVEQGRLVRMRSRTSKAVDSLPTPSDMALPPPVVPCDAPVILDRESQFGALEKSLGGSAKPPGPGARTPSAQSLKSGTAVNTPESPAPPRSLERKISTESLSSSSWQAASSPTTSPQTVALARLDNSIEKEVDRLEREIRLWSPATHAIWGLWGMVFAREEVESILARAKAEIENPGAEVDSVLGDPTESNHEAGSAESFDNLRYALGRFEMFREEFKALLDAGLDAI